MAVLEIRGAIMDVETIALVGGRRKGLLGSGSKMAPSTPRKSTGTKRTASGGRKRKSSASSARARRSFVLCLSNRGFSASLEARKLYRALPDAPAAKLGLVRVVDESGQSYLYPAKRFGRLALPPSLARALAK